MSLGWGAAAIDPCSLSRSSRGEGWGEGLSGSDSRRAPLTRIAPDDASHRRGDPTSPRKRGEVRKNQFFVLSTSAPFLIQGIMSRSFTPTSSIG
jgi:hypothetical protein